MPLSRRELLAVMALSPALELAAAPLPSDFRRLAPTPPMGWNSWDSFGPTISEDAARDNAKILAERLLPFGYDTFTIDIQWYEPGADSYEYRRGAQLTMDDFGRLMPAPNRFPSAAQGAGFKPLADYVHGLGLKFGIHMMRGVPRQAADRNLPILGTKYFAADIADRVNVCPWNSDMFGIDMHRPGAQAYYDSLFALYAQWGVDFIKADDMSRPYRRNEPEIRAVRSALDRCGRPMVLSLSPGETPLAEALDVRRNANLWRISDDFWDTWPLLLEQFARLRNWSAYRRAGNWPDADMLPLGVLDLGRRRTRLTPDEQVTLMTLWSIARSPLIMGGDLRRLDEFTLQLLTNPEVIEVNQKSRGNHEVFMDAGAAAWTAADLHGGRRFLALFNLADASSEGSASPAGSTSPAAATKPISIDLARLGLHEEIQVRDLWRRMALKPTTHTFAAQIPAHGAGLFSLSPV